MRTVLASAMIFAAFLIGYHLGIIALSLINLSI